MKIEDAYIGLKVKALNSYLHEKYPKYFPKEGTKGKIVAIYDRIDLIKVQWKKGSTSLNDTWYISCENVALLKNKRIFVKSKRLLNKKEEYEVY